MVWWWCWKRRKEGKRDKNILVLRFIASFSELPQYVVLFYHIRIQASKALKACMCVRKKSDKEGAGKGQVVWQGQVSFFSGCNM